MSDLTAFDVSGCRRLAGRVAIVTGAARGIGRACAERLRKEGACVVAVDLSEPTWLDGDDKYLGVAADLGQREALAGILDATATRFGVADILVNNAGILIARDFLDQAEQEFDDTIRVNLKSTFLLSQMVARALITARREGSIVNMSSINGSLALATHAAYSASKAGIDGVTRVAAVSLAPHGIRVNAVAPGTIGTDMIAAHFAGNPEARDGMMSRTPLGRAGSVYEVAAATAFLASDDASFITGQVLYVDGGRSALNMVMPTR